MICNYPIIGIRFSYDIISHDVLVISIACHPKNLPFCKSILCLEIRIQLDAGRFWKQIVMEMDRNFGSKIETWTEMACSKQVKQVFFSMCVGCFTPPCDLRVGRAPQVGHGTMAQPGYAPPTGCLRKSKLSLVTKSQFSTLSLLQLQLVQLSP